MEYVVQRAHQKWKAWVFWAPPYPPTPGLKQTTSRSKQLSFAWKWENGEMENREMETCENEKWENGKMETLEMGKWKPQ